MHFDKNQYTLSHLTATDAFGRTFPVISDYKKDRYVGIFYFLCHTGEWPIIRNMTELLETDFDEIFDLNSKKHPNWCQFYFNEPLYGYYASRDPWVMRKHIEQFIMAGIDYLAMDFTNNRIFEEELFQLMDLLLEYRAAGWNAPKVTFYVNLNAEVITRRLYEIVYMNPKYKDIVFYEDSEKPMLISVPHELSQEMKDFFDVRISQFHRDRYPVDELFYYMEATRPPMKTKPDVMNVSIAQMSGGAFGYAFRGLEGKNRDSFGRGWSSASPKNHDALAIERGDNFQEEWDYTIRQDPKHIFVTGWNEWWVAKIPYYKEDGSFMYDVAIFWDTFNTEYSRDAEMTKNPGYKDGKEGYGDNYYLQMASNIRKYKGLPADQESLAPISIDIHGDLSQWAAVQACYVAFSTKKTARDCGGNAQNVHYIQAAPENFVKEVKVAHDQENIYFLIETEQAITEPKPNQTNWMNLFIGVEGIHQPIWETFHYVLNRHPGENGGTSLEHFTQNGTYQLETCGAVAYCVAGKTMQIVIPKRSLGISGDHFSLNFKVADSIEKEDDILDYYVSGESFPMGRMAFVYKI